MDLPGGDLERLMLRNLLDGDPQGLFFTDVDGRIVRASRVLAYALGHDDPADLIGHRLEEYLTGDLAEHFAADHRSIVATGVPVVELHEKLERPDAPVVWLTTSRHPLLDDAGQIVGTFGVLHDITAHKHAEGLLQAQAVELARANAELRRAESELRTMLEATPDPTMRLDRSLHVVYINPAAAGLYGSSPAEMLDRSMTELAEGTGDPVLVEPFLAAMRRVLQTGEPEEIEGEARMLSGPVFLHTRVVPEHDRMGTVSGLLVVSRDLTARKRVEDLLAERALRDPLTGLANRTLFTDRLQQALTRSRRTGRRVAVLFLDLDHFKAVNDTLGHAVGDALLVEVAHRLRTAARRSDTVARFGGDEFVVLCDDVAGLPAVVPVAERILHELVAPFVNGDDELRPSASVGIAMGTDPDVPADALIRDADAAMYLAKARRPGTYQVFDTSVRDRVTARLNLEEDLRRGMELGEFRLVYQPLVTLPGRVLTGVEALLRWHRADGTVAMPAEFIPAAETTGQIVPLGQWVLEEAVRQVAEWNAGRPRSPGLPGGPLNLSVNVSARQLVHPSLARDVAAVLDRYRLPPHLLTLEVTETAMLEGTLVSAEVLDELSKLGVKLALDDFGTGYSSLGHLRRFPVDMLKIDRMFVEGLGPGSGDTAIVAAVTAMAHALGIRTVGEGIETTAQLDALVGLGCEAGQGFLIAHPLDPDDLAARYLRVADVS